MEYTALYRKFRPRRFDEIVGQEHIIKTIKNEIINDRVGHAYLFNGGRGTGKTSAAKILARAVNCLNPKEGEPCNECEICKAALDGSLTDIVEMDAASNNSVEDVRAIRDEVNFLPTLAKYRVYIIDEVHMLSIGAFNALLKTLEEPPAHVKFILATTEPQKLPATILSRCQRFDFKKLSTENIGKRLNYVCDESKIDITPEAKKLISILAEGAMRDALSILERCMQEEGKITEDLVKELVGIPKTESVYNITKSILEKDYTKALNCINEVIAEGKDIVNYLWEIIKYVKDILIYKTGTNLEIYSEEEKKGIKELADSTTKENLISIIYELSNLQNDIKWSSQKLIMFQVTIIKLCSGNTQPSNSQLAEKEATPAFTSNAPVGNAIANSGTGAMDSASKEEINNLNYKVSRLEKEIDQLRNSARMSTTNGKNVDNQSKNVAVGGPKPEIKKIKAEELGSPIETWPKIIGQIKQEGKISLSSALSTSTANQINDMTVGIRFEKGLTPFGKTILERPENMSEIVKQVSIDQGKPMRVVIIDNNEEIKAKNSNFDDLTKGIDMPINIIE